MKIDKLTVLPDIAQTMIDLQLEHSIPVEIIVGERETDENGDEQQELSCEYKEEDWHAFKWLIEKAIVVYVNGLGNGTDKK